VTLRYYTIEDRPRGSWQARDRFPAWNDSEACGVFEAEIIRDPLTERRLVESFDVGGIPCARILREHLEA
jgi:hypothetical protein